MQSFHKIAGIGLIVGAVLQITRMIPIAASNGIKMLENFPPHTVEETLFAAKAAGWRISHIMVFISVPFFIAGFYGVYQFVQVQARSKIITIAMSGFLVGLILYTIGAVIDGLFLATVADNVQAASGNAVEILQELTEYTHHFAVSFGGLSFAHLLLSTGVLGFSIRELKDFKIIGVAGMIIGFIALAGYLTGILDLLVTSSFLLTGGLTMIMFIYFVMLGIKLLKIKNYDPN